MAAIFLGLNVLTFCANDVVNEYVATWNILARPTGPYHHIAWGAIDINLDFQFRGED